MEPDLATIRAEAERLAAAAPDGDGLGGRMRALVALAVAASPTTLDNAGVAQRTEQAVAAGATSGDVTDVILLASAIGMHALHEAGRVARTVLARHDPALAVLAGPKRARLDKLLADPYWARLDEELPGFVEALLALSPRALDAFVAYCAVPFRHGSLRSVERELACVALDAQPSHRYLPGLRLHVRNAVDRGATRTQILEAVELAAAAGPAHGIA
jgi:alkylhydroperoxidase/carboxymuconolactone decarboxylase family protein YurZ